MLGSNLLEIEDIVTNVIIKDYIPIHKGNYNILTGAGGTGKSQVALKMLAHFLQANPNEKGVAIFTEDTKATVIERLDAITRKMRISTSEIIDRTFFKTLDNNDGKVFISKINKQNIINEEYLKSFILNAKFHKIGIVIFDPLEAFHTGLSENDAEDMKIYVTDIFQKIGVETGSAVVVLHHTAKGNDGGSRGSGVITNKGRVAYNIRKLMDHDKDLKIDIIKKGWEHSVFLSTIKDNHYIARYCDVIMNNFGKLDLPVYNNFNDKPTEIVFGVNND